MLRASYVTVFLLLVSIIASAPTLVKAPPGPGPTLYVLEINVAPSGAGTTNPTIGVHSYPPNTVVSVRAIANKPYSFDYWLLDNLPPSSANPITVTMNDFHHLTAVFIIRVAIDIKPGSDPNSINLKNKGVVPVAVLTDRFFDASTLDPSAVTLAGASPVQWTLKDVNGDGLLDLVLQFRTKDLVLLTSSSTEATLTGSTYDGDPLTGTDTVNIVK